MVWPEKKKDMTVEKLYIIFFLFLMRMKMIQYTSLKELCFSSILFSRFRLLCSNSFTHIEHQVSTDLLGHLGASLDW